MAISAGLVSVTTGSPVVSGSLTSFVAAEGDQFILRGLTVVIAQVVSPSKILLKQDWVGPSISGASDWDISLTGPYWQSQVTTNKRISDLLTKFEAGPVKWDQAGTMAGRNQYDDQPAGFTYLSVDPMPFRIYTKLANTNSASDWSDGQVLGTVEADYPLFPSDIGLGKVDNTSDATKAAPGNPIGDALNVRATRSQLPILNGDTSGGSDAGASLSSDLAQIGSFGGGRPRLPRAGYRLDTPLVMREATCVEGQGSSPSSYAGQGTVFTIGGSLSAGFVGPNSGAVHTAGLHDFTVDARNLPAGGAAIRAGFLESRFSNIKLQGKGSFDQGGYTPNTIGKHHVATAPSWINWSMNMLIGGFAIGKRMEGSDSLDFGHYISGNQIGYQVAKSTASIRTGHMMMDLASIVGMNIQAPDQTDAAGNALPAATAGTHTGHIFHFNNLHASFDNNTWPGPADFLHAFVGCVYHYGKVEGSPAVIVGNNVRGLTFAGNIFYANRGPDLQFGSGVSGITLHYSSDQAPNNRLVNMPLDSHVLTGGIGGQYNYLNSLILNSPTNPGGKIQETRFAVYGNDSILGASGVNSRFGLGRDAAGFDAALLIGIDNGNSPYFDACNGEKTSVYGFAIKINHSARMYFAGNGNIGINNGAPDKQLDIKGDIRASGNAQFNGVTSLIYKLGAFAYYTLSGVNTVLNYDDNDYTIYNVANNTLATVIAGRSVQTLTNSVIYFSVPISYPEYLVSTVPSGGIGSAQIYVANGRKVGESAGNGSGVMAYYSAGRWRRFSDDTPVAA
ncbi:hypothetical protein [Methylobacterium aquaticum]|uniref:Metallophosphoesterase n=1 Tax=Methylobacterium aquaticum TaxID=270351 RepID=A0A0C6EWI6_9HYPH|nr:hypothetical protein [Methylobacterium aquaticum]BAQ44411.1 metallophosphoesterase [Methylobacterium aquaticum]